MSRRPALDAVIVGGGVVGAACALSLAGLGLEVALVEGREPVAWSSHEADLRVYAFAADNAALLDTLGVWESIRGARAQPYRRMRVWDAAGGGELSFDADTLGRAQLGWIIENTLLVDRLWEALPATGVRLRLDDGARLDARIVVAADGADSTLRRLAGFEMSAHDYGQRGVVAFVETERSNEATAWQRFLPGGPLAFLPFTGGRSSIVWTLPDEEAGRVLALDDEAFNDELTRAFEARLGAVRVVSARAAFPLRRQLADAHVAGRVLLIGDAAHVVHPLAGQGVNLGLRDVARLRETVVQAQSRRADWFSPHRLARWSRQCRSENAAAAYAFDGINRLFSNDEMHMTLLRGWGLGLAGKLPPVANLFWRKASGL